MSQINSGLRSILSSPIIYNLLQSLLGANSIRSQYMNEFFPVKEGDSVLDIGCGTGEILSLFPDSINYYGFDMSQSYIDFAKKKFQNKGQFEVGLVDELMVGDLPKFDWVLATGLLHHLDDSGVTSLLQTALKALSSNGRFVAIDPCFDESQSRIANWLIKNDRGENVRYRDEYSKLASENFDDFESHLIHQTWIPYTHNILVCKKNDDT